MTQPYPAGHDVSGGYYTVPGHPIEKPSDPISNTSPPNTYTVDQMQTQTPASTSPESDIALSGPTIDLP